MEAEKDIVHLYPKTSCPCGSCKGKYEAPTGIETNLSVRGCEVSPYYNCYNTVEFRRKVFPQNKKGITELNPQLYTDKADRTFNKIACKADTNSLYPAACDGKTTYSSPDPRTYDAVRAQYLRFDSPPMNGDVRLKNINKKEWNGYGQGFTPYQNIKDGQITYYWDKSIEDPFFEPVFGTPALEQAVMYKDPMGAMKPTYTRKPLVNTDNPAVTTAESYPDCLSFVQDSQTHREDLMSLQMRKRNQQRWMPRWST